MIRYRLDDLGWYQFEWLVQSLLKAELGLGIQSWGGLRDYGRDAYFKGPLNFPAKHLTSDGPFVFQIKFVEEANAAGASPKHNVLRAVRAEADRIGKRIREGNWEEAQHYALYTNAPLSKTVRDQITSLIKDELPETNVHPFGGNDVCDMLDKHGNLSRSFPQLLSLRDLNSLILDAVNKENIERSRSAIEEARDLVPVFVPTSAYSKTWEILRKHRFAVLEGPPEMGKTAIAWMIALTQVFLEWDAIACDEPQDFFMSREGTHQQVFVADDAFGRTEYDPTRARKWESQLARVYRQLDSKHWLIWTSRRHILERAKKSMDLQGDAGDFPNPGAILVRASDLTEREKALILYRHSRAGGLAKEARGLVRSHARAIVGNTSFTPERIKTFVREALPQINLQVNAGLLDKENTLAEIQDAIRNATAHMKKSFRALPPAHKWLLIGLLEASGYAQKDKVKELYETHCPPDVIRPFQEVFEELSEAFLKVARRQNSQFEWMDWTHPSYRDLVIDEMALDAGLHLRFLETMSLPGLKLAVSQAGGTTGEREYPLMKSRADWELLRERCSTLTSGGTVAEVTDLLSSLKSAAEAATIPDTKGELIQTIVIVCDQACKSWDRSGVVLDVDSIRAYSEASLLLSPMLSLPRLERTWHSAEALFKDVLSEAGAGGTIFPKNLKDWVELTIAIRMNEPRLLRRAEFPEKYVADITRLLELVEQELNQKPIFDSGDEMRSEAWRLDSTADALDSISSLVPLRADECDKLAEKLRGESSSLEQKADELDPPQEDPDDSSERNIQESFDIEGLFSDL